MYPPNPLITDLMLAEKRQELLDVTRQLQIREECRSLPTAVYTRSIPPFHVRILLYLAQLMMNAGQTIQAHYHSYVACTVTENMACETNCRQHSQQHS